MQRSAELALADPGVRADDLAQRLCVALHLRECPRPLHVFALLGALRRHRGIAALLNGMALPIEAEPKLTGARAPVLRDANMDHVRVILRRAEHEERLRRVLDRARLGT